MDTAAPAAAADDLPPTDLPLDEVQMLLEQCVEKLKGPSRNYGRNAFAHLRKAWRIYDLDKEMSLLRAITAEEEAATALILALKHRQYPGSERLDHRKHDHKAGVAPFLEAVGRLLGSMAWADPRIHLRLKGDAPRLEVSMSAAAMGLTTDPHQRAQPEEPFLFTASEGKAGQVPQLTSFDAQVEALASERGAGELLDFIRARANLRNQLLYAQAAGIPNAQFPRRLLLDRLRTVSVLLQVTVGVLQTPQHQAFAVQCLQAFLKVLRRLPDQPFDLTPEPDPEDYTRFVVSKLGDAPPEAEVEIRRRVEVESLVFTGGQVALNMTTIQDGEPMVLIVREIAEDAAQAD